MKALQMMRIRHVIPFVLFLAILLIRVIGYAEEGQYPMKVKIIDKDQARYDTPENSYAAMISSLIKKDLEWYYETFTKESAAQNKREYEEAGIDPRKKFETVKGLKEIFIIDRIEYKSGVLLIVKSYEQSGAILQGPSAFVKEDGKWKLTNKFSADVELHKYLDYEPSVMIYTTTKIRPRRWNLNWYNWVKGHMGDREWIAQCAERISILSIIGNLKDNQGNHYRVDEILPETLLLNNVLPPQPWKFKEEEKIAIILKSRKDRNLRTRKGFKEWHRASRFFKKYQGPVMLVKFNKFKAMETLPAMIPGKEYDVTVSGELKDGKAFKGSTNITITEWRAKHRWKWNHPGWLNSDKDVDHWWNKEKDLEDLWEKIRKHPPPKQRSGMKRYRQ